MGVFALSLCRSGRIQSIVLGNFVSALAYKMRWSFHTRHALHKKLSIIIEFNLFLHFDETNVAKFRYSGLIGLCLSSVTR